MIQSIRLLVWSLAVQIRFGSVGLVLLLRCAGPYLTHHNALAIYRVGHRSKLISDNFFGSAETTTGLIE